MTFTTLASPLLWPGTAGVPDITTHKHISPSPNPPPLCAQAALHLYLIRFSYLHCSITFGISLGLLPGQKCRICGEEGSEQSAVCEGCNEYRDTKTGGRGLPQTVTWTDCLLLWNLVSSSVKRELGISFLTPHNPQGEAPSSLWWRQERGKTGVMLTEQHV